MANKWTDEQLSAISSRNENLLLSAAAGSGKTAVLVERIIRRLTDKENPVSADRLLVVTFTNAAAAEMRERIILALTALSEENPTDENLKNQLLLLKKAQITTIDSFCIDLLRNNFVTADLPPDFKIADPTENTVMREEVLETVLTEMYDDEEFAESYFDLLEMYANSKANNKSFCELVDALYNFSMSLPDPENWLIKSSESFNTSENFEDTIWCKTLLFEAKKEIESSILDCDTMIEYAKRDNLSAYHTILLEDKDSLSKLLKKENYNDLKTQVSEISFKRRPNAPKDYVPVYFDTINDMRDKVKKHISGLTEDYFTLTAGENEEAIHKIYPAMKCLCEIVIRLNKRFKEEKLKQNLLDFSDCEHMCLEVLTDENGDLSEIAKITREKYDEIYIDEYQDTSRLQEAIFSSIKKENNLFMVGDIKQSIYRFRNTDPSLFKNKRDLYLSGESDKSRIIYLSKNFRSRENVLASVNYIFERIMSEDSGEIDYNDSEKLYTGATFPENDINPIDSKTEVCIIDETLVKESDEVSDAEKYELQALLTAKKIAELIENRTQVFDKGSYRPIKYSDICIISRNTKSSVPALVSVLSDYGIPCYSENTGSLLDSSEVLTMLNILSVIDNPISDIPLLSVLRSLIFGFSSETLAKIRCFNKKSSFYEAMKLCAESDTPEGNASKSALELILNLRKKSKYLSVSELIMDIYNSTGIYDAQQTQTNGELRRANLMLLYNRAKDYEKTGLKGLYNFIRFINSYKESGSSFDSAKTVGAEHDAVRIMSIHKSKGLEFPVVILFSAEHRFNMQDLTKSVLYHAEYGFGPKFVDTDLRITYPFAPRVALSTVLKRENIAEEMRILYVALTRAKEKLIIIGSEKDSTKKIISCSNGGGRRKISNSKDIGNSYLDWILTALVNHPDCDVLRNVCGVVKPIVEDNSKFKVEIIKSYDELMPYEKEITEEKAETETLPDEIKELISYNYPDIEDTRLPSKITVTELKRKMTESDENTAYLFAPSKKRITEKSGLTFAEIGTAYHTVMQHIDLSASLETKDDISEQIRIIKEKGFLTQEEAGAINAEKIARFFNSRTGEIMKNAKSVRREVMFGIQKRANELLKDVKSDKNIMLQGIIDCVAETDEGLFIIDYKTDKTFNPEDTVEKYKIQLECYKMAAEMIYGKKVISKILYLFDADMGVNI